METLARMAGELWPITFLSFGPTFIFCRPVVAEGTAAAVKKAIQAIKALAPTADVRILKNLTPPGKLAAQSTTFGFLSTYDPGAWSDYQRRC